MAATARRRIACFCDEVFEADLPSEVDVAERPAVVDEVLRGEFMAVSCPACGKRLTPEFPCRFVGVAAGPLGVLSVALVPEADRAGFLAGRLGYDLGQPDRVAVGYAELAEKLAVFRQGLDDRAVEIVKYLLITRPQKPEEAGGATVSSPDAEAGELSARFAGTEGDRLVFHITGVREGEVAVTRVERRLYLRIVEELAQRLAMEPFSLFCAPPWVSVRRVEQENGR